MNLGVDAASIQERNGCYSATSGPAWRISQATEFIGNIFASQAGHHSRINRQVYAAEAAGPLTGLSGRLDAFERASHVWQQLHK